MIGFLHGVQVGILVVVLLVTIVVTVRVGLELIVGDPGPEFDDVEVDR